MAFYVLNCFLSYLHGYSKVGQSIRVLAKLLAEYERRSRSFAIQYNTQMTQAKFSCYYPTQSPLTAMHMLHLSKSSLMPDKYNSTINMTDSHHDE